MPPGAMPRAFSPRSARARQTVAMMPALLRTIALLTALLLPAVAAASAPAETLLRYRAFVAGAPVGEAEVTVRVADGEYQVRGQASSNSFLSAFSPWRNAFAATGRIDADGHAPAEFGYQERSGRDSRDVSARDGEVLVIKNGRPRSQHPIPEGLDVVSALFVAPGCDGDRVLHTGRHAYRLLHLAETDRGCRYRVSDEDDSTFDVELSFGHRDGLRVPERITVYAWVTGWVELQPAPPQTTAALRPKR